MATCVAGLAHRYWQASAPMKASKHAHFSLIENETRRPLWGGSGLVFFPSSTEGHGHELRDRKGNCLLRYQAGALSLSPKKENRICALRDHRCKQCDQCL